jgi:hypothetical protein
MCPEDLSLVAGVNTSGTFNILNACVEKKTRRLVRVSDAPEPLAVADAGSGKGNPRGFSRG